MNSREKGSLRTANMRTATMTTGTETRQDATGKPKINSRQKGARGERQWRDELRANGYVARRGQQFSGSADSPDVVCNDLACCRALPTSWASSPNRNSHSGFKNKPSWPRSRCRATRAKAKPSSRSASWWTRRPRPRWNTGGARKKSSAAGWRFSRRKRSGASRRTSTREYGRQRTADGVQSWWRRDAGGYGTRAFYRMQWERNSPVVLCPRPSRGDGMVSTAEKKLRFEKENGWRGCIY